MSPSRTSAFLFATKAQWASCLFVGADRQALDSGAGPAPSAPWGTPPQLVATRGAIAPTITDTGDLIWRDDAGVIQRLHDGDTGPVALAAPTGADGTVRMVAAPGILWTLDRAGTLQALDIDSLSRLLVVATGSGKVVDIAAGAHGSLYALVHESGHHSLAHVDRAGRIDSERPLDLPAEQDAPPRHGPQLAYLHRTRDVVVLTEVGTRLSWIDAETGTILTSMPITTLRPCFDATVIGNDGCDRLFIAGVDGRAAGGRSRVLTIGDGGDVLGNTAFDGMPTGLVADRRRLCVTTSSGLLRFEPAGTVPLDSGELRTTLVTPALQSPAATGQRWTRIEADADLPEGCTIEISLASCDDSTMRDTIAGQLANAAVPAPHRLHGWREAMAPVRTFVFHGKGSEPGPASTFSVPLHDIRDPYLCIGIAIIAAPGSGMPRLRQLVVHYPGLMLIDNLPAIYRRGEFETGSFLRGLVGVLEATTQDLDGRIADLGHNIHPKTAPPEWLDFVARWMGLPWHDALSADQKRRIVVNARALADSHGTRRGLELLLASLLPGEPPRFRIVDLMADYGVARLGHDGCPGARLPAMLAGLPKTASELGNKAMLGSARLACGEPEDITARLAGRIRVDLALDSAEERDWSPWLRDLIESVLPAAARVELRWLGRRAFTIRNELHDDLILDDDPPARLGTDAVTGLARLGGNERTTIPDRISGSSSLQ
ncbi:phage tail protein [Rhizobium sp. WYJ-E13]|uniref:phage tail protein n=1 Tax=Rhizobium sp. WYJ-E13 TaxID=2849093 RepID=UPI001C1EA720|nr:phage tail protein [Rhizobium sp. WYJ-E13]QWW71206.1 hypothetical protein KQ933_31125 [Rhizobium sp. WYJ-E13]